MLVADVFTVLPRGEFHTWTDTKLRGSRPGGRWAARNRGAFAPCCFATGQRSSDVARMGGADLAVEGGIWVVQQKTKAKLLVPLHPEPELALARLMGRKARC